MIYMHKIGVNDARFLMLGDVKDEMHMFGEASFDSDWTRQS
jgi:hypothetical protein